MVTEKVVWITGSTGYLGRNFFATERERFPGARWVALVRKKPLSAAPGVTYLVAKDSEAGFSLDELRAARKAHTPDLILHFATHFQNAYSAEDGERMIEANIRYPNRMLEACADLPALRFLNFGSFYSHGGDAIESPVTFYAAAKRAFEIFLNFYTRRPGWKAITLKIFDTYGPHDDRPKLVPKWVEIAKSGETLKLSPGGQRLSLVHVDDVKTAILRAAEILAAPDFTHGHRIYQLPAAERPEDFPTLKEVAGLFEKAAGCALPFAFGALPYRDQEILSPRMDFPILPDWHPRVDLLTGFRGILKAL